MLASQFLPTVLHQAVHLTLDMDKQLLSGWTQLTALPPAERTAVGLHCQGLTITRVLVDGISVDFTVAPPLQPSLDVFGNTSVAMVAEHAYDDYRRLMRQEHVPELIIALPPRRPPGQALMSRGGPITGVGGDISAPSSQGANLDKDGAHGAAADGAAAPASGVEQGGTDAPVANTNVGASLFGASVAAALSVPPAVAPQQDTICLEVHFQRTGSDAALQFNGSYAVSDPTLRRARALFPCVDLEPNVPLPVGASSAAAFTLPTYDFHITVPAHCQALCSGTLVGQTMLLPPTAAGAAAVHGSGTTLAAAVAAAAAVGGQRRFHYRVSVPLPPGHMSVTAGPFCVVPHVTSKSVATVSQDALQISKEERVSKVLTHFGPPDQAAAITATTFAAHLPLAVFENYLGCSFPFEQINTVFLPCELVPPSTPLRTAGGLILASSDLLFTSNVVEASVESRLALASGLARHWFGCLLLPRCPEDAWLVEGLAAHLEGQFIRQWLGVNELAYRRHKEREAVFLADDGQAPPLCPRPQPGQMLDGWGLLYGSEALDPGGLLRWKSAAVVRMLERRIGEDQFRRLMETYATYSATQALAGGNNPQERRLVSTQAFLKDIGRLGNITKDIGAFADRWIYGRGCPRITAGMKYIARPNLLQVAVRQQGSMAARRAAQKSAQTGKNEDAISQIKVVVSEVDGVSEGVCHLGPDADLQLVEITLTSKPGATNRKPRGGTAGGKGGKGGGAAGAADDDEPVATLTMSEALAKTPIHFVRVDPAQELLAQVCVQQTEAMWAAQLERSRDVVAQSQAISGLARIALDQPSQGIINVLSAFLKDSHQYCRVRVEAALALGVTSSDITGHSGVNALCSFFYDHARDPATKQLRPFSAADLSQALVMQSLPLALSLARSSMFGHTQQEAYHLITHVLGTYDSTGGDGTDDSAYLASFLEGLGHLRVPSQRDAAELLKHLDRYLVREEIMPSYRHLVGCACLRALTSLAAHVTTKRAEVRRQLAAELRHRHAAPTRPHAMRATALQCLLQIRAASDQLPGLVDTAVELLTGRKRRAGKQAVAFEWDGGSSGDGEVGGSMTLALPPSLCYSVLEAALEGCGAFEGEEKDEDDPQVSPSTALQLYRLMHEAGRNDVRLRQYTFMLLQRIAGQPATLYREREEEELFFGMDAEVSLGSDKQRSKMTRLGPGAGGSCGTAAQALAAVGPIKIKLGKRLTLPASSGLALTNRTLVDGGGGGQEPVDQRPPGGTQDGAALSARAASPNRSDLVQPMALGTPPAPDTLAGDSTHTNTTPINAGDAGAHAAPSSVTGPPPPGAAVCIGHDGDRPDGGTGTVAAPPEQRPPEAPPAPPVGGAAALVDSHHLAGQLPPNSPSRELFRAAGAVPSAATLGPSGPPAGPKVRRDVSPAPAPKVAPPPASNTAGGRRSRSPLIISDEARAIAESLAAAVLLPKKPLVKANAKKALPQQADAVAPMAAAGTASAEAAPASTSGADREPHVHASNTAPPTATDRSRTAATSADGGTQVIPERVKRRSGTPEVSNAPHVSLQSVGIIAPSIAVKPPPFARLAAAPPAAAGDGVSALGDSPAAAAAAGLQQHDASVPPVQRPGKRRRQQAAADGAPEETTGAPAELLPRQQARVDDVAVPLGGGTGAPAPPTPVMLKRIKIRGVGALAAPPLQGATSVASALSLAPPRLAYVAGVEPVEAALPSAAPPKKIKFKGLAAAAAAAGRAPAGLVVPPVSEPNSGLGPGTQGPPSTSPFPAGAVSSDQPAIKKPKKKAGT